MNKVIQLLESTKQKQETAMRKLPKMVDEHVAMVASEGEQFIKEIDQALLVLSNVSQQRLLLFDFVAHIAKQNEYVNEVNKDDIDSFLSNNCG